MVISGSRVCNICVRSITHVDTDFKFPRDRVVDMNMSNTERGLTPGCPPSPTPFDFRSGVRHLVWLGESNTDVGGPFLPVEKD